MPTKEAKHIAEFLLKMILRHGCPLKIVSDQGRDQLVDLLEELTRFKHKITSAYHPQSNGLDERFNQTLKAQLQKPKCTPFLLMYGREARLPIDVTLRPINESQQEQEIAS